MRHHLDPARRTPSLQLGHSGPVRVAAEPTDPAFEPPPFLGFKAFQYDVDLTPDPDAEKWAHLAAADELRLVELNDGRQVAYPVFRPPLLWQDDGDQA